jgi:hypothetical protein
LPTTFSSDDCFLPALRNTLANHVRQYIELHSISQIGVRVVYYDRRTF